MVDYRIYVLGRDGHFARAIEFTGPNDDAALARALAEDPGFGVEVWQLGRFLGRFQTEPRTPMVREPRRSE